MITFNQNRVAGNQINWIAEGWGQVVQTKGKGAEITEYWKNWACAKVMISRLEGFIKNRRIAYHSKGYVERYHILSLEMAERQVERMKNKPAEMVFRMILSIEMQLRTILPAEVNQFYRDLQEILDVCKKVNQHNRS